MSIGHTFKYKCWATSNQNLLKVHLTKKGLQLTKMFPSMSHQSRPLQGLRFVVTSHVNVTCGHRLESNSPAQHNAVIQRTSSRHLILICVR